jgi:hypothetical protein
LVVVKPQRLLRTLFLVFLFLFFLLLERFREEELLDFLVQLLFLCVQFFEFFGRFLGYLLLSTLFGGSAGEGRQCGLAEGDLQIFGLDF